MDSTTAPKAVEPDDVVVARADERLVHAYDQIARADEQLARLNEQLARLENEAKHHPSAVVGPRPPRGRPGGTRLHRLDIGRGHLCPRFRFAVFLRRSGQVDCRPVGAAAHGFVALDGKTGEFLRSPGHLAFSWPRRPRCFRNQCLRLRRPRRTSRRQPPRQHPSWRSCSRRWRAISQTWSRGLGSSRRTRNKRPATMRRSPRNSRRARSK